LDAINYDTELRRAGASSTHGWRKLTFLAQRHMLGTIGLVIMLMFVLAAALADGICRFSPLTVDSAHALSAPNGQHWMGTDSFGRDVWSRIIHGARISLAVGIGSTALGSSIGVMIGLASGYLSGWVDLVCQRVIDILQALPLLVLALVMSAALGPSLPNTIIAIAIPLIPTVARVIRANTLALRELAFVEAAKSIGMSEMRIALRHVAVVSRSWDSRAVPVMGTHAFGIGRRICSHRAVAGDFSRGGDQSRRVRNQSSRRCAPRHSRPEAARLMSDAQTEAMVLDVKGLRTVFFTNSGLFKAVDDVSFSVRRGKTLAIVGESGCGKSVTALSVMRLVPDPPGRIVGGSIMLEGTDLLSLDESEMRAIRGNRISMIFQEPMTSLNPVMRIGDQITEAVRLHRPTSRKEATAKAVEMLRLVKIPEAERRAQEYPHQLSGGMRQRAMIAMALACRPALLIADEPTTALDVTIQAQILALILELQRELGMGLVLITHDLGVVAQTAQRVIVMYAGRKVEEADVETLFASPRHPYTRGLMASIPSLPSLSTKADARLAEIPGMVPSLTNLPKGCAFAPRCELAVARCREEYPPLQAWGENHLAACWRAAETARLP
jgi:peptide/nickel transport system ATP-binding protein